jgi:hypothetical protein
MTNQKAKVYSSDDQDGKAQENFSADARDAQALANSDDDFEYKVLCSRVLLFPVWI